MHRLIKEHGRPAHILAPRKYEEQMKMWAGRPRSLKTKRPVLPLG